jgi:short-subunit dehydrogenase
LSSTTRGRCPDIFIKTSLTLNSDIRYGLSGPFETLSEKQIRQQMEINFFGLMDVTRKAMETMRELKTGGVIQNVTSIGGQIGAFKL